MDTHKACATMANMIERTATKQDTAYETICRNDVQALCFAIGYIYRIEQSSNQQHEHDAIFNPTATQHTPRKRKR